MKEFCSKGNSKKDNSSITIQSWQRFRRLINNSISDDIFVNAKSSKKEQHQVYLSDEIININGGEMKVVDIAGLTEQLQCLVFGDIIRSVYSLKHGDYDPDDRSSNKPVPKKIVMVNAVKVFTLRLCISAYYIHFKRVKVKIFTAFTIFLLMSLTSTLLQLQAKILLC